MVILILIALGVTAAVLLVSAGHKRRSESSTVAAKRPTLLLLTRLPLLFNEDFSLQGGGSSALKALQLRYRIVPISTTDEAELAKGGLLLMAQPGAQSPADLVALDQWVRTGGRVLLLADPMLEWPSKLQLGDPARAPLMFVDTGLLGHWGVKLDAPEQRGPADRELAGHRVLTVSPGALYGRCPISGDQLVADCRIGQGEAIIVADADFLDINRLGAGASHNLDGLLAELAILAKK